MASSSDLPVIQFVSLDDAAMDDTVTWLLWPVQAWRVIGPKVSARSLNVFQRAVLGMIVAGRRTVDDVAARLELHRDLVFLIFNELTQLRALDEGYGPTDRGREMLDDEEDELSGELVVGHVFTDPFTGELWPRIIHDDLRPVEVDRTEKGWPRLKLGSVGRPRYLKPFVVTMPASVAVARPDAKVILDAARIHARVLRSSRGASRSPSLLRAWCLDESPSPYLVLVRVYHDGVERFAEDPFGVGTSERLTRAIEKRIQDERRGGSSPLGEWLRRAEPDLTGDESVHVLHARAEREVEGRLTVAVHVRGELFERLVAMQRAAFEAAARASPRDKRDDVSVKAQKSIEHALGLGRERWWRPECERLLTTDPVYNAALIEAIARDCGFETPLPHGIVRVVGEGFARAFHEGGGKSLRAPLASLVLSAQGQPDHPARAIAREDPAFLKRLDALAAVRNRDGHDSADPRRSDLDRVVEDTLRAAELLIKHCL
jgi:hypothetical protein